MAIEYISMINKQQREKNEKSLKRNNSSTDLSSSPKSSSSNNECNSFDDRNKKNSNNEAYTKGLNDGMNAMLKFLRGFNQLENKINEQSYDHAEFFINNILKTG